MNKRITLLLFFGLLTNIILVRAQDYFYKNYTTSDGLPSSEVYHVFQDSKGYIWFATDNGVSKYNGYEFENFDLENGLPESSVSDIYEDYKGRIWFIGMTAKLSYYWDENIIEYPFNDKLSTHKQKVSSVLKSAFFVDTDDNVYITIKAEGIFKISKEGIVDVIEKDVQSAFIHGIYKLSDSLLLPASFSNENYNFSILGFKKINRSTFIDLPEHNNIYPTHQFITKLTNHPNSIVYGTGKYIYLIENMKVKESIRLKEKVIWMKADSENSFWVGLLKNGATKYQYKNNKLIAQTRLLDDFSVSSVLCDMNGVYWFSTLSKGAFQLKSNTLKNIQLNDKNSSNVLQCIEVKGDTIWAGYDQNLVHEIYNNKIKKRYLGSTTSMVIKDIYYEIEKGQLLIGTPAYIYFVTGNEIRELINNFKKIRKEDPKYFNTTKIISDNNNGYWVSSGFGFFHIKNFQVNFDSRFDKNFKQRVDAIFLDSKNNLWLGSRDGLRVFRNNQLKYYGIKYKELSSRILDIVEYNGILIFATKGNGILFFDGKKVIQIGKKNGLTTNIITSLAIDNGILWAGSPTGLNEITIPLKLNSNHQFKITPQASLNGMEIKKIKIQNGKIYIVSNDGLLIYHIPKTRKEEFNIPLILKSVNVNGIYFKKRQEYNFNYNQNNFTIQFEALQYYSKKKIEYKYQLKGLDTSWIYTSEREARYYHLRPGKYEFVAMVKNLSGEWEKNKIVVKFTIVPAIWQTFAFKIAFILFILSTLLLLFKYMLNTSKYKTILKKNIYTYKMKALLGQMNPHFIFNTLNSINRYILTNNNKDASRFLVKFSKLMRTIIENSQNEYISLKQEIDGLEHYLEIEKMRLQNKLNYSITVSDDIDLFNTKIPTLLIQPYVENSIWHGIQPLKKTGVIFIRFYKHDDLIMVDITDNGVGRKKSIEYKKNNRMNNVSYGTKITNNRLELLTKETKKKAMAVYTDLYSNTICLGTKVTIQIPLITLKKTQNVSGA